MFDTASQSSNKKIVAVLSSKYVLNFRVTGPVSIAFVIMPDHFHLIVNPRDGDIQGFAGALNSLTARRIIELTNGVRFKLRKPGKDGSLHQVWQDSFKAISLWSLWMIWQKINYIHSNPVRARLVKSAKDYTWTSFRAFYSESEEPLPLDHEWWWPEDSEKLAKASELLQERCRKK